MKSTPIVPVTARTAAASPRAATPPAAIRVRGARTHNLKGIDLDLPLRGWTTFCGVSGSGKTSMALDTLYAEGQRRYIESLSFDSRQFVAQLPRPDADEFHGMVPAVAIRATRGRPSARTSVGSATEIADYLQWLFGVAAVPHCPNCQIELRCATLESIVADLNTLANGTRLQIGFAAIVEPGESSDELRTRLISQGFVRSVVDGETRDLTDAHPSTAQQPLTVIVDRLVVNRDDNLRCRESLATAMDFGHGRCCVISAERLDPVGTPAEEITVDGRTWFRIEYQSQLRCPRCDTALPERTPRLFDSDAAQGACPQCEGFGDIQEFDMDLIVPDPDKSIREGAIAPWNTPAYAHELQELLDLADEYELPVDIPFSQLKPEHVQLIWRGVKKRKFGGLDGFFAWLQRRIYRMHHRIYLNRWRQYRRCPGCQGQRLNPTALAFTIGDLNLAQLCDLPSQQALRFLEQLDWPDWQRPLVAPLIEAIERRMQYLCDAGLPYLALGRPLRTLSDGEQQRVALTSILSSNLVNLLYVLDEPSSGLHPADIRALVQAINRLRDRGNTVVVVDHEPDLIRSADAVVEFGPRAGFDGGQVVFHGSPQQLIDEPDSLTGNYLAGRRGIAVPESRRQAGRGSIRLVGASGNNLQNIDVDFPLGVLCVVAGVSGAGKSSLVRRTLYPALALRQGLNPPAPLPYQNVLGAGQIDEVILVERKSIGRSSRSNPVTYVKAFDEIRQAFAQTPDAKSRNITASHFSFNVDGGRCGRCKGEGILRIDMQFMEDLLVECDQCNGKRYRPDVLQVRYRDKTIDDVLNLTVRQAFGFFRGQRKIQARLQSLFDVGLDYLRLGQPLSTLSTGEAQRLKLASFSGRSRRGRCLFLLEEPTTGLHMDDVVKLVDCLDALLAVGHSVIVVEHNLQLMQHADWIIELGPGPAADGGRLVACGTPEQLSDHPQSTTGPYLRTCLERAHVAEAATENESDATPVRRRRKKK